MDQISQIFEKIRDSDAMATGLARGDIVQKFFNLDLVGIIEVKVMHVLRSC